MIMILYPGVEILFIGFEFASDVYLKSVEKVGNGESGRRSEGRLHTGLEKKGLRICGASEKGSEITS